GGRILLDRLGKVAPREKARADLVTDADLASQSAIAELLQGRFPQFEFFAEESTAARRQEARASGRPMWIVDPLDGTANYVHRLPGFSVSIALVEGDRPRVGVVYDPLADTMYAAVEGSPSTKNGRPLRSSGCEELSRSMVCCSFRPGVHRDDPEVAQFLNILESAQTVRRLGSAALNLCYLAEGCLDAYWATSLKAWDVAAGYLIAGQAGVAFCDPAGQPFDLWQPRLVAAATVELQRQVLACLRNSASS
ncbi:MAG: inositol monophosphatase, partial [Planctomycetota bacterium]